MDVNGIWCDMLMTWQNLSFSFVIWPGQAVAEYDDHADARPLRRFLRVVVGSKFLASTQRLGCHIFPLLFFQLFYSYVWQVVFRTHANTQSKKHQSQGDLGMHYLLKGVVV